MSDPIVYKLTLPIVTTFVVPGGDDRMETLHEITLRSDVRAKDLRAIDHVNGEIGKTVALIAHLSGLAVKQVDDMGIADFAAVAELVGGFMPPGLLTGETA